MDIAALKNTKVLITGHTGFKGSWLLSLLHHLGVDVVGYASGIPTEPSMFVLCGLSNMGKTYYGDVRNYDHLREVISKEKPEVIFHMAAQSLVRESYENPLETYQTNVMGTVNVLDISRRLPFVRAIVNITTDKCYNNNDLKIEAFREDHALGGKDPYSSSKACSELVTKAYIESFFRAEPMPAVASVRAGNVLGGGDWAKDRLIPDFMRASKSGEKLYIRYLHAIRPWQHVLDPLYGYLLLAAGLLEGKKALMGAWNFGPDIGTNALKVCEVLERLQDVWPEKVAWEQVASQAAYEATFLALDSAKAGKELGWHARYDIEQVLEKTAQWYRAYFDGMDLKELTMRQIREYIEMVSGVGA